MQLRQTDIRATTFVAVPSRTVAADGRVLGPEQAARYLGLRRRELGYPLEAGLLTPSGRSVAGTVTRLSNRRCVVTDG